MFINTAIEFDNYFRELHCPNPLSVGNNNATAWFVSYGQHRSGRDEERRSCGTLRRCLMCPTSITIYQKSFSNSTLSNARPTDHTTARLTCCETLPCRPDDFFYLSCPEREVMVQYIGESLAIGITRLSSSTVGAKFFLGGGKKDVPLHPCNN